MIIIPKIKPISTSTNNNLSISSNKNVNNNNVNVNNGLAITNIYQQNNLD
jgi:hypothetical protein